MPTPARNPRLATSGFGDVALQRRGDDAMLEGLREGEDRPASTLEGSTIDYASRGRLRGSSPGRLMTGVALAPHYDISTATVPSRGLTGWQRRSRDFLSRAAIRTMRAGESCVRLWWSRRLTLHGRNARDGRCRW